MQTEAARQALARYDGGRIAPEVVRNAIILALQVKPLRKHQLREALGINEWILAKALKTLRMAGTVKVIGHRRIDRAWALTTWSGDAKPATYSWNQVVLGKIPVIPTPPARSWWADLADPELPREVFRQAAEARNREMQADRRWMSPALLISKRFEEE